MKMRYNADSISGFFKQDTGCNLTIAKNYPFNLCPDSTILDCYEFYIKHNDDLHKKDGGHILQT